MAQVRSYCATHTHIHQKGNFIAIEWPQGCSYWKLPKVRKLIKDLDLKFVYFDGCMLGLRSIVNGLPIRKPWAVCTNSEEILKEFSGLTCCGHSKHQPCQGVDTKVTEEYIVEFVEKRTPRGNVSAPHTARSYYKRVA